MFITKGKISNMLSIITVFAVAICLFGGNAYAQMPQQPQQQEVRTDFTDEELEKFVEAAQEVMTIQQQIQQEMMAGIESEGLTVDEFNQMFEAMQDPEIEVEATPEEQEAFDNAMEIVNEVQQSAEQEVGEAVEDAGLNFEKYDQIMMAYQQDPEIQERINELMQQ